MTLGKNAVLNGHIIIREALKKQTHYYLYVAEDQKTGDEVFVTEYYPPEASRDEEGFVIMQEESHGDFDNWVNNLAKNCDNILPLQLNNYLKINSAFLQNGTGYIVSQKIDGITLKEHMENLDRPLELKEAAPLFLDLLKAVEDASSKNGLYFHLNCDSVYMSDEGTLRITCFYATAGDEESTAKDMADLFYFMLANCFFDVQPDKINTKGMSKRHERLVEILLEECKVQTHKSLKSFYNELYFLYYGKKADKELRRSYNKRIVFFVSAAALILACCIILILFLTSGSADNPSETNPEPTQTESVQKKTAPKKIEFDIQ